MNTSLVRDIIKNVFMIIGLLIAVLSQFGMIIPGTNQVIQFWGGAFFFVVGYFMK